jgi:hypothetical protein
VNFTEKLIADQAAQADQIAAQAAEIAELKQFLADLIAPPQPEPERIDGWRKSIPKFTNEELANMVTADAAKRRAEEKARYDAAPAGLPQGQFRDPCGLVRWEVDQKIVPDASVQAAQAQAKATFGETQRQEHEAWMKSVDLPLRHQKPEAIPALPGADDA